jgi:hypothetical protein
LLWEAALHKIGSKRQEFVGVQPFGIQFGNRSPNHNRTTTKQIIVQRKNIAFEPPEGPNIAQQLAQDSPNIGYHGPKIKMGSKRNQDQPNTQYRSRANIRKANICIFLWKSYVV